MNINIITIFPEFFIHATSYSILKRAQVNNLVKFNVINLRDFSDDNYQTIDDRPYGGGAGMVMMIAPVYKALKSLNFPKNVILPSPKGNVWSQNEAQKFSMFDNMTFIVPHFEGIDQRVIDNFVDFEISVGPYILSGGELPVMTIIDSTVRLKNGVLGNPDSLIEESYTNGLLEYPQYTRPKEFNTIDGKVLSVPDILLSGNHSEIEKWKKNMTKKIKQI